MTRGEKIAKLRKEQNYTQEQLADILGVSRQAISKWESNIAYPETEKLIKMGELFGCSMDYLLNDKVTEKAGTSVEVPLHNADSLSTVDKPVEKRIATRHIMGAILLAAGLFSVTLGVLFSGALLFLGAYFAVCGILCLAVKKRPWLWLIIFTVVILLVFFTVFAMNKPGCVVEAVIISTNIPK